MLFFSQFLRRCRTHKKELRRRYTDSRCMEGVALQHELRAKCRLSYATPVTSPAKAGALVHSRSGDADVVCRSRQRRQRYARGCLLRFIETPSPRRCCKLMPRVVASATFCLRQRVRAYASHSVSALNDALPRLLLSPAAAYAAMLYAR